MPRNYKHPMFQKRHYWTVADTIRQSPVWTGGTETETLRSVEQMLILIENFVEMFKADNSLFKPDRFRDACNGGVKYEVTAAGKRELLRAQQ